ncbi:riboflavin synthase [Domibacillus sp. DTU_2020_1001157_1_SI_ALB_TIR_016]|uniref:riboflavin synthase n=1 Tax=Domibacillus sp. DTU_2020_1001157_1_SI_ALB_TIR_016 TaxID=3077789 RepID=UPI0028EB2C7F|nr:riboflavin synthase [Domibacillus sp. DTU_2020_1001157_1_SI_ALB_TIR_016]WNS82293.1 riboflavin synthase [Domibacillus sp. DTU_2020_1001157_1_SI_ALB_TIR_016]
MFTGIIEELGTVERIVRGGRSLQLTIAAKKVLEDVHLGDSISVSGVCLTVTTFTKTHFTADVMPETFTSTALAALTPGARVNLERAMAANGRFGGHFVSGHVDGVGHIVSRKHEENALYVTISYPEELSRYFLYKGSVALDGTSLTLFGVTDEGITVSLIPHTQDETILASKSVGDPVNIECDMLAKYVGSMLEKKEAPKRGVTMDLLKESGYL